MPDILPVSMQDILYSRKPDLRAEEIGTRHKETRADSGPKVAVS